MIPNMAKLAYAVCAVIGMALPAKAQVVHPDEQVAMYMQVKGGWTVYSITHNYNGFIGCRAVRYENGNQLVLELYQNLWQVVVPTNQAGVFGGGILGVGKVDFDAQFGFQGGFATKQLTSSELGYIKSGNQLGVEINGDFPRHWSLAGSTAAILKVQECYNYSGRAQATQVPQTPQTSQPQSLVANCDSPTNGPYRCTVTKLSPEPGYQEAFQIEDSFGQAPAYFFKIRPTQEADTWVAFDNGPWLFMGVWEQFGANNDCSRPKASQEAEAWNNLGQDAWELCVR